MNKIRLLIAIVIVLIPLYVIAAFPTMRVEWEAGIGGATPTGFKIYYSDNPSDLDRYVVDAGNVLTIPISSMNLSPGVTYSIYATAYNSYGESGPSNMIYFTLPAYHIGIN